jgi:hypothetical protein
MNQAGVAYILEDYFKKRIRKNTPKVEGISVTPKSA